MRYHALVARTLREHLDLNGTKKGCGPTPHKTGPWTGGVR
jgi:aerobic-type carbon monoxide dehydrogenase small subunit (CoxS/CutS family)